MQVNFAYEIDGRPFYPTEPGLPAAAVRINSRGSVVSASARIFPNIAKTGSIIQVVSPADAVRRLTSNQGVLLRLFAGSDRNEHTTADYLVKTSTITSIALGYYYSPGSASLSPVYVFEGSGQDNTTNKEVQTTTMVSALP